MSELIQKNDNRATIRWKLLTGASALALTAYVSSTSLVKAEDASQPQVWVELGGQLNRLQAGLEIYKPPFLALTPSIFSPPQKAERPPLYGLDENAGLSFQPEGSDWMFSASVRYGKVSSNKHIRHQTYPGAISYYDKVIRGTVASTSIFTKQPIAARFADANVEQSESQTIVDFQVGKDVGLGLFGQNTHSSLEFGVRFAQFSSKSQVGLKENPDWHYSLYKVSYYFPPNPNRGRPARTLIIEHVYQSYHSFAGAFQADRSFHGVGPSLSWKSSVPFAGNSQDGELTLDWGVNAALLFGRQKAKTQHQTTEQFHPRTANYGVRTTLYHHPASAAAYHSTRSRNVTVPNVGGSVGLSWQLQNFKMSLGYRADFFFNAIDGGIDARKSENRGFFGPYASISIGLGD